jgi:DNA polymerase-1
VGEKTAAKLLSTYRDFDELYAHLDQLTPKLRENLATYEQRARQNEVVMRLVRDVPLDFTLESLTLGGWDRVAVGAFFDRFEMNSMRTRFEKLMSDGLLGAPRATSTPSTSGAAPPEVVNVSSRSASLAQVVASSSALTVLRRGQRVAVLDEMSGTGAVGDLDEFLDLVGERPLSGHDIKELYRAGFERGITLAEPADDTAIMAFLVDATSGRYDLADVAQRFLDEVLGTATPSLFDENADDDALFHHVGVVARLRSKLRDEIERWELGFVYTTIELPLVAVLGRMEARGIRVDVQMLRTIAAEFTAEAQHLDAQIQEVAGHEFKINSPQQLQTVLFSELGLTPGKKIKTGFSTDASALESIADEHRIVPLILRFREVEKLRSTYGAPLIGAVGPDGRIHAQFHQTVARTGRLSSENPNLHNIPVRSAEGRRLRFAFVPSDGWSLAVADYNQIELRILAHLSQDSGLLAAFASHEDVHRTIAASVFGISPDEVTHEQREQAKAVSYGLAYGMEAFGLSQRLGVPVSAAKEIMDKYFAGFPTLRRYMDETIKQVRAQGFSRTEFGRIRPFPDLATAVGPQRAAAERQAMNAGIQGLGADIFKSALVRLDHRLTEEGLQARLILQVHDEVLVEAPPEEIQRVETAILEALTEVANLSVPLEVTLHWGDSWAAAKG